MKQQAPTNAGIVGLNCLHITYLDISECVAVTGTGLSELKYQSLSYLNLEECSGITDAALL